MFGINLTHTETATVTMSTTLEATAGAPAVAALKTALQTELGILVTQTYTFENDCGWTPLAPCNDGVWKEATLDYTSGKEVRIDHEWHASGAWISVGGGVCPIAGNTWSNMCRSESSTASGDPYSAQSCGNPTFIIPCPSAGS